eukprot:jgi/Hompol1/1182/HPOL_004938-RA
MSRAWTGCLDGHVPHFAAAAPCGFVAATERSALPRHHGPRIDLFLCWPRLCVFDSWNRYTAEKPSRSSRLTRRNAPSVSILRPLKGLDCNFEANLESSFCQDYPNFEIVFSVDSPNDPAVPVVEKLRKKHSHVPCSLIINHETLCINPKVNNLARSYEVAGSDIIWILDSNVQMDLGALGRAVDLFQDPKVGLVQHLPCGVRPGSLGSLLDAVFLNCTHARMHSLINWVNVASCVIGKSNLFRREAIDSLGGLQYFGRYMAEDNMIGIAVMNNGLSHRVAPDLAYQALGSVSLQEYFNRRARWTRIRKYAVAAATLYEPFTESLFAGYLAGWAFNQVLGIPFWPFFILNFLGWFISDVFCAWVIHPGSTRGGGWTDFRQFLFAWLVREFSAMPVYLWAMSGSTVEWRGKRFYLHTDGTVEPLFDGKGPQRPVGWLPRLSPPIDTPPPAFLRPPRLSRSQSPERRSCDRSRSPERAISGSERRTPSKASLTSTPSSDHSLALDSKLGSQPRDAGSSPPPSPAHSVSANLFP